MLEFKDQYVAVFVKTINGVITIQGRKKFKINIDVVTFRGKSFHVDTKTVSYRVKNKFVYLINLDGGQQVVFMNDDDKVKNSELANLVVEKKVIAQLVAGLVSVGKQPWVVIIIALALGICLGYIIGNALPL